jgi:transporter family-2 protein
MVIWIARWVQNGNQVGRRFFLKSLMLFGALGALATGVAIGVQSALSSRTGALIGDLRTGLMTNLIGGSIAGVLVVMFILFQGKSSMQLPAKAGIMLAIAGALGIAIITGVAFSLQRTGVAAGLAIIILGQLVVSVIVDTRGMGGVEPIPLSVQRVAGLLVMAVAVFLLMPRE